MFSRSESYVDLLNSFLPFYWQRIDNPFLKISCPRLNFSIRHIGNFISFFLREFYLKNML